MMKVIIFVCLLSLSIAEDGLRTILRSPQQTLKLYSNFKAQQHLTTGSPQEDRMRLRLFVRNAKFVADCNEHSHLATFAINKFSAMTDTERYGYRGLNITHQRPPKPNLLLKSSDKVTPPPLSKLWTESGAVTEVQDQKRCGSCWTFAATGAIESRYKAITGVLRKFSEQELLDCVYRWPDRNGCKGGAPNKAFRYTKWKKRLAAKEDYPYEAKSLDCRAENKPNALIGAYVINYRDIADGEKSYIEAIASGAVWAGLDSTDYFMGYNTGLMRDESCKSGKIDHAVALVGYTPEFILAKNSWGADWGDKGFVKFERGFWNCGIFRHGSYPVMTKIRDSTDTRPSDSATDYSPDTDSTPIPPERGTDEAPTGDVCADEYPGCEAFLCSTDLGWMLCGRTCGRCDGPCPKGTVRCSDHVCRHVHMC